MAIQGKAIPVATIITALDKLGMGTYGNSITQQQFDRLINNVLPLNPSCKDCNEQNLARLTYVGIYRDYNLGKGLYTGWENGIFHTQPLNKTFDKVKSYKRKSVNAALRGKKLNNSMPKSHNPYYAQNSVHFDRAIAELKQIK